MSIGRAESVGRCGGHVHSAQPPARPPRNLSSGLLDPWGAARRGRRDFLGCHDKGECNGDVGAAGADGAYAVGAFHELAEGIRQAALDPVPDHNAGAERG
jgi:hypothetical protein